MTRVLDTQAERLHEVFAELVRAYQFRDREQVCGWGLSVSQCYALETLHAHGPMAMSELATALFLEASTVTRIIDRLVEAGLVERTSSASDRRVCRAAITDAGRRLVSRVRDDIVREYVEILAVLPGESREAVITTLQRLLGALRARQEAAGPFSSTSGSALGCGP